MKILITGSTGFIGSALLDLAIKNYDYTEIYTASRTWRLTQEDEPKYKAHYAVDLSVQSEVEWLFQQIKPNIIFHLASEAKPKIDRKNINKHFVNNTASTNNICEFCPDNCKIVLASSIVVYGDFSPNNLKKETDNLNPNSIYGLSKVAAEHIVKLSKKPYIIARLGATVGSEALTHGVLYDFFKKAKSDNPIFEVIGEYPGSCKPYMHVNDVCNILIRLAKNYTNEIFNVTNDYSIYISNIVELLLEVVDIDKEIRWLGADSVWKGDDKGIFIDTTKLQNIEYTKLYPSSISTIEAIFKEKFKNDV